MVNADIYNKVNKENLIVTFLLILKSTQASIIAISPVTTILFLIYVSFIFNKRKLKFSSYYVYFTIVYFIINIFYFVSFDTYDLYLSGYVYLKFLYAYISIRVISFSFFKHFGNLVYYGALISLPFYLLQIINYDLAFEIVSFFQRKIYFLNYRNDILANNILFTIEGYAGQLRNSGFMWEPKGFANILSLSIVFNILLSKNKFLSKRNIVLLTAVITTYSTVGYFICFVIIPLFVLYNSNLRNKVFLLIIIPFVIISISRLDFMYDKIKYELTLSDEHEMLTSTTRDFGQEIISLGRVGSFLVDINDFYKRPILGYGVNKNERTQNPWIKLIRVNGFSDLLATWGLFGFFFYVISHFNFFKSITSFFKMKGVFFISFIFLVIYIATTLTLHPLWMSFLFINLIIPSNINEDTFNSIS
ncbi:MAG: hypothetical protein CMD06_00890 [Flavobacteriales bacterium]|nr:hypothetical protein [Flavobacteriales bacterium]